MAGADLAGLDLFLCNLPQDGRFASMMPLPTWKNDQGKLVLEYTFAGQGLGMICEASERKKEVWEFVEFVMKKRGIKCGAFFAGETAFPYHMPQKIKGFWKNIIILQSMGKLWLN